MRTCPTCGKWLNGWNRWQVAGHMSRHSPKAHHLTQEERLRGARRGFQTFAQRYADGDARKAIKILVEIGNFAADPVPENGAFRLSDDVPNDLRQRVITNRVYA
ncbi:MAG TPA: hypothetical protein PKD55_00040 [Bellilinea sp.]|nr:hypothetical protein [Bellilinea sp.]